MEFTDNINPLALIAERKIKQAMDEGQFDSLPGYGRPQKLEDLSAVPPDLRLAYIILKNSGHLETSADEARPADIKQLLAQSSGEGRDRAKLEKLNFLLSRTGRSQAARKKEPDGPSPEAQDQITGLEAEYLDKLLRKV